MKYTLEITQKSDGETTRIEEPADGEFNGDMLVLHYIFDGAEYKLTLERHKITQLRSGAVNIKMRFLSGQTTLCRITDGCGGGQFEIFTKSLKVDFDGLNVKAECEFYYAAGGVPTCLSIAASAVQ